MRLLTLAAAAVATASAAFSGETNTRAVYLSEAAYCTSSVKAWTCGPCGHASGVTVQDVVSTHSDFAYVAWDAKQEAIIVSFRGSSNIPNWIQDLSFTMTDYDGVSGARVHHGFYHSYLGMRNDILVLVNDVYAKHQSASVIQVVGHSLGAAQAVFAAVDLGGQYEQMQIQLYTFGQPRTGNDVWASHVGSVVGSDAFRTTHHNDPVPHVPPKILGFHHTATEVWQADETSTETRLCDGSGEDKSCSDGQLAPVNVGDHLDYLGIKMGGGGC